MTPLAVTYRKAADLVPYDRNARTHTAGQIEQIAAAIREFGWTNPVLVDERSRLIAGHGRLAAALSLGMVEVPTICLPGLSEAQRRALVIADNKLATNAGWDGMLLASELSALRLEDFDLGVIGFTADELLRLLPDDSGGLTDPDESPELPVEPVSIPGDVWLLDKHRVMCGDSTSAEDVAALMLGQKAALLHADPPYGMGKAAEGVANDNLYGDALDRFQMAWWAAMRPHLDSNGSAYIWGNAPELWRLWYAAGGLAESEELDLCNEIVWDKKSTPGMGSEANIGYQTASERCLFFKIGKQYVGNINADDFPEHWEPLRSKLAAEAAAAGIKPGDIARVCGCSMFSHWFSRSQFTLVPEKHYRCLAAAYPGYFTRPWAELYAEWARVRGFGRGVIHGKLDGMRSFFDNAHEVMRDVWEFSRVTGEERHGHATPKPVAMMARVMKSSLPLGGLCVEPFGGSGSTLMGAETTGRVCFVMELSPAYVDVIVQRWQSFTGKPAMHEASGMSFAALAAERRQLVAA